MKQVFLEIEEKLRAEVPAVKYVDKNWGQLQQGQPPVQWPCVLIDLDHIEYSGTGSAERLARVSLTLTVADRHGVKSSGQAPRRGEAYQILDLLEQVMETLEGWRVPGTSQALTRERLSKSYSDASHDVYELSYSTAWVEAPERRGQRAPARIGLRIERG